MRGLVIVAALAALAACNQGSGPPLPRVQEGAQAPSTQTPQPGVRQGQVTNEVRQQLLTQITQFLDQTQQQFGPGMAAAEGARDQVAPMQPATDLRWIVNLNAGARYVMIGACDGDCTNVDIELIDMASGGVVASDMLPDDFPVVNFAPAENGPYMVRLLMQSCSVAPCYAGGRVLMESAAATAITRLTRTGSILRASIRD